MTSKTTSAETAVEPTADFERSLAELEAIVDKLEQGYDLAPNEIKQLITDSVGKVEEGSHLVDRAGKTMGEIVTSVKRVTDIIADISAASQEQSSGIDQVNQAILQMDEGTQQNAALVEEASAAARSLEQQSTHLVEIVAAFQLDAQDAVRTPAIKITRVAEPAPSPAPAAAPRKPAAGAASAKAARPVRKSARGNGAANAAMSTSNVRRVASWCS